MKTLLTILLLTFASTAFASPASVMRDFGMLTTKYGTTCEDNGSYFEFTALPNGDVTGRVYSVHVDNSYLITSAKLIALNRITIHTMRHGSDGQILALDITMEKGADDSISTINSVAANGEYLIRDGMLQNGSHVKPYKVCGRT